MKKKMKNLMLTILFLAAIGINAQEGPKINSSEVFKKGYKAAAWTDVLGQDDTGYYLLSTSNPKKDGRWILEKYNPDLTRAFRNKIDQRIANGVSDISHHSTKFKNGKVYMFLSNWRRGEKKGALLVKTIDSDGNISKEEFKVGEESAKNMFKTSGYRVSFSPDGNKLAVLTQHPRSKKEKEKIRLEVFNTADFSSVWKKDLTLQTPANKASKNKLAVNNEGIAYLFKIKKEGKNNYDFKLHVHGASLEETSTIDLGDRYPREEQLRFDQNGNFVIHGMMVPSDKYGVGGWSDTWYLVADKSGKITTNQIEPLGKEFLSNIFNERNASKDDLTLANFYVKDVLVRSDGGFYLLTERRTEKSSSLNTQPASYVYNIENKGAYIFSYDVNGKREWETFIPVRQKESTIDKNIFFSSYAYRLWNDQVYMIWNHTDPMDGEVVEHFGAIMQNKNTVYPALITVVDKTGSVITKGEGPLKSKALPDLNQGNESIPMAIDPSLSFATEKGMMFLSRTKGTTGVYYKMTEIEF